MHKYRELEYKVSFTTPAFLGGAEQEAEWRTPPFKALIREWWRVVIAADCGFDVDVMRKKEHSLFGHAANSQTGPSGQSRVRLRLSDWEGETLTNLHTEANDPSLRVTYDSAAGRRMFASVGTYLGYGPIQNNSSRSALCPDIEKRLTVTLVSSVDTHEDEFDRELDDLQSAINLANQFGAMGSRSRNGWGSLQIQPLHQRASNGIRDYRALQRPLKDCLRLDWQSAIGTDGKMLGWICVAGSAGSQTFSDWKKAMLALLKVRIRVKQRIRKDPLLGEIRKRHAVSYPIKDAQRAWGPQERIPNQLRFKVLRNESGYSPVIVHLPRAIPSVLLEEVNISPEKALEPQIEMWREIHQELDHLSDLKRLK